MKGPLEGVRVLDLTHSLAGLFCTMFLADLGAEVIKLEPPQPGQKGVGARFPTGWAVDGIDLRFFHLNRNKKSLALDLKSPIGQQVFYDLVRKADAVVDNFRPAVLKRLGVAYENLAPLNPRLISCSITSFGSRGPYRDRPAMDSVAQALSGVLSLTWERGQAPVMGLPVADLSSGILAAQGLCAALYQREGTGLGQQVEVSLLDACLALLHYEATYYLNTAKPPPPRGTKVWGAPLFGLFRTRDGYVALSAVTEKQWQDMCQVLGCQHLLEDARFQTKALRAKNSAELNSLVEALTQDWNSRDLITRLQEVEIPASPINTLEEAFADRHIRAGGMVVEVPYQGRALKTIANPVRLSACQPEYRTPPGFGEHTREVLGGLLGYSPERIEELKRAGVIH